MIGPEDTLCPVVIVPARWAACGVIGSVSISNTNRASASMKSCAGELDPGPGVHGRPEEDPFRILIIRTALVTTELDGGTRAVLFPYLSVRVYVLTYYSPCIIISSEELIRVYPDGNWSRRVAAQRLTLFFTLTAPAAVRPGQPVGKAVSFGGGGPQDETARPAHPGLRRRRELPRKSEAEGRRRKEAVRTPAEHSFMVFPQGKHPRQGL